MTINTEKCKYNLDRCIGIVTALCPHIGYTNAARLAKKALKENRNIRDIVIQENIMPIDQLDEILDPKNMI